MTPNYASGVIHSLSINFYSYLDQYPNSVTKPIIAKNTNTTDIPSIAFCPFLGILFHNSASFFIVALIFIIYLPEIDFP